MLILGSDQVQEVDLATLSIAWQALIDYYHIVVSYVVCYVVFNLKRGVLDVDVGLFLLIVVVHYSVVMIVIDH